MSTLLVTIVGPEEKVDLAVSGEAAIDDLMPTLLAMAVPDPRGTAAAQWTIDVEGGSALPRDRTLSQCGVADGAVLNLRPPSDGDAVDGERAGGAITPGGGGGGDDSAQPAATVQAGPDRRGMRAFAEPPSSRAPAEPAHPPSGQTPGGPGQPPSGQTSSASAQPGAAEGGPPPPESPPPPEPPAPEWAQSPAPDAVPSDRVPHRGSPLERTRQGLPSRLGAFERIAQATTAIFGDGPEATAPAGREGAGPRPSKITVAQRSTPYERARATWRKTDYTRRLDASIVAPRLRQAATIAVVSPKGGVGKTTITALLGSLLAHTRRDRIVAVDTNPDYGSLGPTLTPDHDVFVDDLLGLLDDPDLTVTQLDANLGRGPDGLMVLPAPTDPQRMARLHRRGYVRVIEYLQTKAGVLILDCGTGLQEPAAQAAVLTADQLVLVSDAEPATATLVTQASKLLLKSGVPLMVVVNKFPTRGARLDLEELAKLVPNAAGMGIVQANPRGAARVAAGDFTWDDPAGPWEVTLREMASSLLSQWADLGLTAREHGGAGPGVPER